MSFKAISFFVKKILVPIESSIEKESENILKKIPLNFCFVKCKNKTLFVSTENPAIKNSIFLKQDFILEELKNLFGDKAPSEIRFLNS